jgi:uncharacterized membrane protein YsdA (DUF1294 family)
MTYYVRKLDRRPAARLAWRLNNGVTVLATLVAFFGGVFGSAVLLRHDHLRWAALAVTPLLLLCLTWVFVVAFQHRDVVWVANDSVRDALVDARNTWQGLPADLRERTKPVIDAAYAAAVLPDDVLPQLKPRLRVLKKFRDEAREQARRRAVDALGQHDVETAEAYLVSLRTTREIGKPVSGSG